MNTATLRCSHRSSVITKLFAAGSEFGRCAGIEVAGRRQMSEILRSGPRPVVRGIGYRYRPMMARDSIVAAVELDADLAGICEIGGEMLELVPGNRQLHPSKRKQCKPGGLAQLQWMTPVTVVVFHQIPPLSNNLNIGVQCDSFNCSRFLPSVRTPLHFRNKCSGHHTLGSGSPCRRRNDNSLK